jgi:tetratricopeptide (TPR) repeat protein
MGITLVLLITTEKIYSSYLESEDKFVRLDEIYQVSCHEIEKEWILAINEHEQFAKIGDHIRTVTALLKEIINKLYTIWIQRGSLLSNLGRRDEAVQALTIAARLRPNEFKKHAFWFAKVGAYQKARQQLEKLNSVKNQELALYVYVLLKLKEYEQAITYLKRALPEDIAPQNYLQWQWFYIGVLMNHHAYEEANAVLQAITPKDEGLAFSATMFIKAQKTEDVLRIINQVIRKLMDSAAVKNLAKAENFTPEMLFLRNLQGETELDITWLLDT